MDRELERILNANLRDDDFVRHLLARLEAITRRMALISLAEWDRLEIVDDELYDVIASLGSPAWGTWGNAISELLKVVGKNLASASPADRGRLENSIIHRDINEFWNRRFSQEVKDLLKAFLITPKVQPCSEVVEASGGGAPPHSRDT